MSVVPARWALAVAVAVSLAASAGGCAGRRARAAQSQVLTAEAAYHRALNLIGRGRYDPAKSILEKIEFAPKERTTLEPLVRLAIADATFYKGDDISLIDARSKYLDFVTLYADNSMAAYAQFQAGMCSLKQVSNPTRDQTETLAAINDLREIARKFPDSPYVMAGRGSIEAAESNLAKHEYFVGRFYMKKKAYLAASARFREIVDKYPRFEGMEKVYFQLGKALILANSGAEGRIYLDKLVTDYPKGAYAAQARRLLAGAEAESKRSEKS